MEQEARVRGLQERIAAALREDAEATRASDFSEYVPDASTPLTDLLARAAEARGVGDVESVEAALDEFERLAAREDLPRLQHALMVFLSQHPAAARLGLRVPPLSERSPSQILPSRRDG
jgi:hypothetical protein